VAVVLYDAERTDRRVSLAEVDLQRLNAEQLLWIDVTGEDDAVLTDRALSLESETLHAFADPPAEPSFFSHENYTHIVVLASGHDALSEQPSALHCLVGSNWVLTVHRQPLDFLGRFDERVRGDSELGRLDGHSFLAAILQEHVASYLDELRPIEATLDRIDLRAMTGRIDEEDLLRELIHTRVRVAKLRRMLEPHRALFALLARTEFAVLAGSRAASDFEALNVFLERALQGMEATREMITGSFEIYTTWTAHGTNKVIKRLTVVSVALLPPTLLAGIMGMNSLPRAFVSGMAFWISLAVIAALPTIVLAMARRQRLV
jgi:magnesium transporter